MALTEDEIDAVVDCYRKGWLTLGPRTREFESELGGLFGCHARAVISATAALHLIFRTIGVREGDEVLMTPSAGHVARQVTEFCGAVPVTAPARPASWALDGLVSARTTTVIVEHRDGEIADEDSWRRFCDEHGLVLVEEVTALLGRQRTRVIGDLACLSLAHPSALDLGSGGAVLSSSDAHADLVASFRSHAMTSGSWERHHGREQTYDIVDLGYNYRFDEPRAVLALARLGHLRPSTDQR